MGVSHREFGIDFESTILANLVGSSVVSAITQTPASGPLGPVTVPPISSLSIATPGPVWPPLGPAANPIRAMMLTARLFVPMAATFSMSWSEHLSRINGAPGPATATFFSSRSERASAHLRE